MSKRDKILVSKEEIVKYWFSKIDEIDFSVDAYEANERCWRCGYKTNLEKCHIIPASLGGKNEVSNLVLLCNRCHIENPNVADSEIMWDWLKAYKTTFYDTFWAIENLEEYKKIYGESFEMQLMNKGIEKLIV